MNRRQLMRIGAVAAVSRTVAPFRHLSAVAAFIGGLAGLVVPAARIALADSVRPRQDAARTRDARGVAGHAPEPPLTTTER